MGTRTLKAQVDAAKNEIHVVSVKMGKDEMKETIRLAVGANLSGEAGRFGRHLFSFQSCSAGVEPRLFATHFR